MAGKKADKHVLVEEDVRDRLIQLRKDKGLASVNELIKRLLDKCGSKVV